MNMADLSSSFSIRHCHGLHVKVHVSVKSEVREGESQVWEKEYDLTTAQYAKLILANLFITAQSITDTGGVSRSIAANTSVTAQYVVAGTGTKTPTVLDYNLQAQTSGGAGSAAIPSGGIGATPSLMWLQAGGNLSRPSSQMTYYEIGLEVTCGGYTFLLCHDVNSNGWLVLPQKPFYEYLYVLYTISYT
jgi:hypothetical protein